ncbi:TauD/TfdA family dioxygenase [Halomonas rhizosphaerae]|uniref:TauD/TfdA family dioxygenase n=1 Tax=Halomonas rhizosphaerae TaxID=3043296 RepID=A0ABT6UXM0_9GAMM|nr:TauD/TfdA family dioxygenase [Halomonas rhizosphaerae]MDI5889983.1 TauD/TfdA family dioxygenase [Halomonas rhizosphaerae]
MPRELPQTPDYDAWPIEADLETVSFSPRLVAVRWDDGRESRYHGIWLRENAADESTVNPATRERILDLSTLPGWPEITGAEIDDAGALCVTFAPEDRRLRFHPGWLRAHDYDNAVDPEAPPVPVTTWQGGPGEGPDSLDAVGLLDTEAGGEAEEAILAPALESVLGKGLVRLRGLPTRPGSLEAIARRIGPLRPTNFGLLFDVKAKPDPDSNAYTAIALPPHVDLPTREYQPGLQMLHCLENSVEGGEAVMLDGFAVAEALRERHPEAFATLTRVRWCYANTARTTDYVWYAPMIRLDERGELLEVRIADFLRGPLQAPFAEVESAYEALMTLQAMLREPVFAIRFTYRPGDLVIFDNRRLLHARDAFEGSKGHRWLQGCYMERDEIRSRYRMILRARRQRRLTGEA